MAKPVNGHDERALPVDHVPVAEPDATLSDEALSDLPDARLVEEGRAPSAQALGVNHRAPATCCESRQVFRRMRQAWWIVVTPGGWPDDRADVAYSDNTVVVGDTSAVMGPVSAAGMPGAEGRFPAGIPFQGAAMLSMITERVGQSS